MKLYTHAEVMKPNIFLGRDDSYRRYWVCESYGYRGRQLGIGYITATGNSPLSAYLNWSFKEVRARDGRR